METLLKVTDVDKKIHDTQLKLASFIKWDAPAKYGQIKGRCIEKLQRALKFLQHHKAKKSVSSTTLVLRRVK